MFPQARYIYIHRNPVEGRVFCCSSRTFSSLLHTWQTPIIGKQMAEVANSAKCQKERTPRLF
eukprot:1045937-Pelagomonas_calceolata.AAC.6